MKEKLLRVILAIVLIFSVIVLGTEVFATEDQGEPVARSNDQPISEDGTEEADQAPSTSMPDIYEGDLYVIFGENGNYDGKYVMDKYVDGNVFIIGQDVEVTGEINGSLFVMATNNLKIEESAYIAIHTFALAPNMVMKGFTSDMYAVSQNFTMEERAIVSRDLKVIAENANIYGTIRRDLKLIADEIEVYQSEDKAMHVYGDFDYEAPNEVENLDKVSIEGETNFTEAKESVPAMSISDYIFEAVEAIAFALIMYLIFIFLAPKFVEKSKDYVSARGALAGVIGLAFVILIPVIAFILILTLVGVYPAIVAFLVYAVILVLNSVITSIAINEFIASKFESINSLWKKLLTMVGVSLVIYLIGLIPVVGEIIGIILFFVGVGITVMYQFDKRAKKEKVEV